jgi:hypothetical protein
MSIFDEIKAKAEELMGGGTDEISSQIEDATNGLGDSIDQTQGLFSESSDESGQN